MTLSPANQTVVRGERRCTSQLLPVWGNRYASELVGSLVKTAHLNAPVTLLGGVAKGNAASAHILQKLGFLVQPNLSDSETEVFALAKNAA